MATVHRMPSSTLAPTLQLRIELEWLKPVIWRRVRVPASITLGTLHQVIQIVMGWTDSHLHEFTINALRYGLTDPDWELPDEIITETKIRLGAALSGSKTFAYLYDFGDSWEHQLKVEKTLPAEILSHPVCDAGEHACPPEDVGGTSGYVDFVHAVLDAAHPEHREMLEWCGGAFDPYAFDIDLVNRRLKRIRL